MSQAPAYNRKKNFQNDSPDRTDHGALNTEFDAVASTLNVLRQNAAIIQRDDGALAYRSVGFDQLTDAAKAGLATPGPRGLQGIQGIQGVQGVQGDFGPVGASFNADSVGIASERDVYDNRLKGFSFFAINTGLLYFKLSNTMGDWSQGFPLGRGEQGPRGLQGIQGIQGVQGVEGPRGLQGVQGIQGPVGTPDLSTTVRNNTDTPQGVQGTLSAPNFEASGGYKGTSYLIGQSVRMRQRGGRLSIDNGQEQNPSLIDVELNTVYTRGTNVANTGIKLANGDDLGTLFDPSGSSSNKLAGVQVGESSVSITGKTTVTAKLTVENNQLIIKLEAA
ncbi:hypothetical protein RBI22_15195 [Alcaligenaceae bacterium C4P045]|nr:hypothetical protein [Alcaligenaceae bacterium C4P045]